MRKSKNRKYLKALSVNIILALQLNTVAFAADTTAVPDASEGKAPIVESAANETVIVDIRTPTKPASAIISIRICKWAAPGSFSITLGTSPPPN